MTNNNKISFDIDIDELLGLKDPNKHTLEYDLNFILENGIDEYNKMRQEWENKKRDFIDLFYDCFDELCDIMEKDPLRRVPISCFTCKKGMELRDKYGSPKE